MSSSNTYQADGDEATTNSYESAFLGWKSSRDHLHQAFQGFIKASQSLNDARVERLRYPVNPQVREMISDEIDQEALNLSTLRSGVDSAKVALLYSRNTSMALAPINNLPVEVLGFIFSLAQPYCVHDIVVQELPWSSTSQLVDIVSMVCAHWRKIALNTRELWSHIDLVINRDHALSNTLHYRAKLWLERVRDYPLHLHTHEFSNTSGDVNIDKLESCLSSCLSHAISVHMWSNSDTPFREHAFPWKLLGARNTDGSGSKIQEISIENHGRYAGSARLPPKYFSWKDCSCESVSVLHLRGVAVPWYNPICHKLTELRLENLDDVSPSLVEIAAVLIASPGLRSFALCETGLSEGERFDGDLVPHRISLDDLEVLNLDTLNYDSLDPILRLLAPGSRPLSMSITLEPGERFSKDVEEFFQRSNVTTLFANYTGYETWCPLPHSLRPTLEVLAIANCQLFLSEEEPDIISADTSSLTTHEPNVCPKLRTMHLLASSLDPELLGRIVATHLIEELWLSECSIREDEKGRKSHGHTGPMSIDEVADLMPENIRIVWISDEYASDPASRWACAE
ncbi:hypothetical protein FRC12_006618 [Ceratobasidium sp. 428]|nr:hypothetical protein FRC12_006618 [Ceratobasidium sp. 428]